MSDRASSHAVRSDVDIPPYCSKVPSAHHVAPLQAYCSSRSAESGKNCFSRSGRNQRCRRSQRHTLGSAEPELMSQWISLRCTTAHWYAGPKGSLPRMASTQPRPTAICVRKASEQARSAFDVRSAWLSLKLMASATSRPSGWPLGVTRQSVRVATS